MNVKPTASAFYRGETPIKKENPVPKSKTRRKKQQSTPTRAKFNPRDPILSDILVARGWRYLGASEIADVWDFPAFEAVNAYAIIACQPDGYSADVGMDGIDLLSKKHASRQSLIQELDLIESWGETVRDLREMADHERTEEPETPHT